VQQNNFAVGRHTFKNLLQCLLTTDYVTNATPALTARTVSLRPITSLQYRQGAAHITFWVKVPPTTASLSATTSARSAFLPDARSPAYAPASQQVRVK